jgi:hypothetical protein
MLAVHFLVIMKTAGGYSELPIFKTIVISQYQQTTAFMHENAHQVFGKVTPF